MHASRRWRIREDGDSADDDEEPTTIVASSTPRGGNISTWSRLFSRRKQHRPAWKSPFEQHFVGTSACRSVAENGASFFAGCWLAFISTSNAVVKSLSGRLQRRRRADTPTPPRPEKTPDRRRRRSNSSSKSDVGGPVPCTSRYFASDQAAVYNG